MLQSHSRAYLSTVKLQMQRLNCHSQLISNSVQFLNKTHFAIYWFRSEAWLLRVCWLPHEKCLATLSLFSYVSSCGWGNQCKKEFQRRHFGSRRLTDRFHSWNFHFFRVAHFAFICWGYLSEGTKWIVHWTSPYLLFRW